MGKRFGNFILYIIMYLAGYSIAWFISGFFLVPICNIFLQNEDMARVVASKISVFLWPLATYIIIYIRKTKDRPARMLYRQKMLEKQYNAKEDFLVVVKSLDALLNVLTVVVLTLAYLVFHDFRAFALLNIPVYIVFEILADMLVHRTWANMK